MSLNLKPSELALLRPLLEKAVKDTLEKFLDVQFNQRVLSSAINHTELQPSGDLFDIHLRIELHEKQKTPAKEAEKSP